MTTEPWLMLGDCLERMKEIPDGSLDMVLCDLPYGTTACKWDIVIPFERLWLHYWRCLKANGVVVLFGSQPFTSYMILSEIKTFKYMLVWDKKKAGNFALGNKQFLRVHEDICVFYKKTPTYNPQKISLTKPNTRHLGKKSINKGEIATGTMGKPIGYSQGYEADKKLPTSILSFSKDSYKNNVFHPTQKPVTLLEYLIKTYTNDREIVLDNCMGSGSTGVACIETGRKFIGIEKDEKYFGIACQRIAEANEAKEQLLFG